MTRPFKPGGIDALYGLSAERIAEICRVHLSTARRWKRGEFPPYTALLAIQMHAEGELGAVDFKWALWRLKDGLLISDDGTCFTPGEVRAIPFMRMQIQSYQQEQRFTRQADWINQRWEPAKEQDAILATA